MVIGEHAFAAAGKIVNVADSFGIETMQSDRVAEVIKEQFALLWDLIERDAFNAQPDFFRRCMTSSFRGAQF
jgi:hypothetical protein